MYYSTMNYNVKSHRNPGTGAGERRCLSRSPGYLTKGIELVGFPHGTAGDGDDRQGYRGSAGNRRAVVVSAPSFGKTAGEPHGSGRGRLMMYVAWP
jgi:hypothetical protein